MQTLNVINSRSSGKDADFLFMPLVYTVILYANGSVWAESSETTFSTWCLNSHRNWPHELVKCDIQIQLESVTNVTLMPLNDSFYINPRVRCFLLISF